MKPWHRQLSILGVCAAIAAAVGAFLLGGYAVITFVRWIVENLP